MNNFLYLVELIMDSTYKYIFLMVSEELYTDQELIELFKEDYKSHSLEVNIVNLVDTKLDCDNGIKMLAEDYI